MGAAGIILPDIITSEQFEKLLKEYPGIIKKISDEKGGERSLVSLVHFEE
jgi:hypothetical protein